MGEVKFNTGSMRASFSVRYMHVFDTKTEYQTFSTSYSLIDSQQWTIQEHGLEDQKWWLVKVSEVGETGSHIYQKDTRAMLL